jgi:hypothetical protein
LYRESQLSDERLGLDLVLRADVVVPFEFLEHSRVDAEIYNLILCGSLGYPNPKIFFGASLLE